MNDENHYSQLQYIPTIASNFTFAALYSLGFSLVVHLICMYNLLDA
jgi:hypothetical protein